MNTLQQRVLAALRIVLGWLFFYAGITKLLDPTWSSAGYLKSAKTFTGFYEWLTQPGIISVVDFLNEWGLTLLGISLILGIGVRISSALGILVMVLYYFVPFQFPYPNAHAFLVDEHVIYSLVLLLFIVTSAGRYIGLERWCAGLPICKRYPRLRALFG